MSVSTYAELSPVYCCLFWIFSGPLPQFSFTHKYNSIFIWRKCNNLNTTNPEVVWENTQSESGKYGTVTLIAMLVLKRYPPLLLLFSHLASSAATSHADECSGKFSTFKSAWFYQDWNKNSRRFLLASFLWLRCTSCDSHLCYHRSPPAWGLHR